MTGSNKKTSSSSESTLCLDPRQHFNEMVHDGLVKRNIQAAPLVQQYLVDLLQHYLDVRNLFDDSTNEAGQKAPSTLAEMYLMAAQAERAEKIGLLKKLGDRTLYISGFFGDSLSRKIVDIDYYVEMGETAYGTLAECTREDLLAHVYRQFSTRFVDFVEVLTHISNQSFVQSDEGILRLYERYMKTGSTSAREKLFEMGVNTLPADVIKSGKQD